MSKKFQTLNIGTSNVELAEYEFGAKGGLTLARYGLAHLDAPLDFETAETALSPALAELVRTTGIKPGPVALAVPGQCVFTKYAAIPPTNDAEKFEQFVRLEIEQGIPFPVDEMVCDRQVLGETENGDRSVMIVAAKTDQIEALTRAVATAGFTPETVDSAPGALVNAVRYLHPEAAETCTVTLWIGSRATSLIISEGDKVYMRLIQIGGNALVKEIATACVCSPEEAERHLAERAYVSTGGVTEDEDETTDRVAKACRAVMTRLNAEVSRSINFYRSQQNGSAPQVLYLTGSYSLLPQLDAFFAESLGLEIAFLDLRTGVSVGPAVDAVALEADVANLGANTGLAAQRAGLARFNVNLLPPTLVAARAEKARIPFLVAGGVTLAAALALVALAYRNGAAVADAQREAVQVKVDALANLERRVSAAKAAADGAAVASESLRALLASRANAAQRLNAVRSSMAPGMWIERWDQGRITIRGWRDRVRGSGGKTAGELFVEKLKGKAVVDPASVKISDMTTVGRDADVEQFAVEVAFK